MAAGKRESKLWRQVKEGLSCQGLLITRIESGKTERGIPDVFLASKQGQVWVELKVLISGLKPSITASQVLWHERMADINQPTWFLINVLTDVERILLYKGSRAADLAQRGIAIPPCFEFERPYDWDELRRSLFS